MKQFPVTRIVDQPDGTSAFIDDSIAISTAGEIGLLSQAVAADRLILRANPPEYSYDWHPAPQRQFILMLTGEIRITAGTGETRTFSAGQVLFVEDTDGSGHKTWNSGGTWRLSAFVTADGDVPFLGTEQRNA